MKKSMRRMIADIEREVEDTSRLIGKRALDPRVMKAMEEVPREAFVPASMRYLAFENGPLPIGYGQTISQPYIVALMSDLLQTQDDHVVLEIGTGSGYQTAILSRLVRQVYSIEVVSELGEISAGRLARARPLQRHHRDGRRDPYPAAAGRPARDRRSAGHPRGGTIRGAGTYRGYKGGW
jgi:protein-L-isoaspartate(D-aspartate) O-methyltransferase